MSGRAAPTTASVNIIAVSPFGKLLHGVKVTRFAADNGRGHDYYSRFTGTKADEIPYGEYLAQIRAEDRVIAASVRVSRENTLIVLSGPNAIIESGPSGSGVVGKVSGFEGLKPVWVRMVRVFSEDVCCTIVPLEEDGTFSFGGLEPADYVLLVLSDGHVLFDQRVRIDAPEVLINVDLAKGQASVQARSRTRPPTSR